MPYSRKQITRIAAYGLLVEDGRILLCRISRQLPQNAGEWTLPGGGLDFGEDPAAGMVREVREETGLIVRPAGLAGVDSIRGERENIAFHSLRLLYFAEILGGELTNEVDGTTDLCLWHDLQEVRSLPIVDLVEAALEYLPGHFS